MLFSFQDKSRSVLVSDDARATTLFLLVDDSHRRDDDDDDEFKSPSVDFKHLFATLLCGNDNARATKIGAGCLLIIEFSLSLSLARRGGDRGGGDHVVVDDDDDAVCAL